MRAHEFCLAVKTKTSQTHNMDCYMCGMNTSTLGSTLQQQLQEVVATKAPVTLTPQLWQKLAGLLFRPKRSGAHLCLVCMAKLCTETSRPVKSIHKPKDGNPYRGKDYVCASCGIFCTKVSAKTVVNLSFHRRGRICRACYAYQNRRQKALEDITKLINPKIGYLKDLVHIRVAKDQCEYTDCEERVRAVNFADNKSYCREHFQVHYPDVVIPEETAEASKPQLSPMPYIQPLDYLAEICTDAEFILQVDEPVDIFSSYPSIVDTDLSQIYEPLEMVFSNWEFLESNVVL